MKGYTFFTTPNELGSNVLPSGYDEVIFELSDGNWINNIVLPEYPEDKCSVVIRTSATWDAVLQLPLVAPVEIKAGNQYTLEYDADIQQWNIKASSIQYLSPNSVGNVIPDNPQNMTYYSMNNCNYATEVTLPAIAKDGDTILIRSTACEKSKVSTDNILYSGETVIEHGEQYVFKYLSSCNVSGWVRDSFNLEPFEHINSEVPNLTENVRGDSNRITDSTSEGDFSDNSGEVFNSIEHTSLLDKNETNKVILNEGGQEREKRLVLNSLSTISNQLENGNLPNNVKEFVLELSDDNWISEIELPKNPENKSRVIVKSSSSKKTNLHFSNHSLEVKKGNEYTLVYSSEKNEWVIWVKGNDDFTSNSVGNVIPNPQQGKIYYTIENHDFGSQVILPTFAGNGEVVTIISKTDKTTEIVGENALYKGVKIIKPGEKYVFSYKMTCKETGWEISDSPQESQDILSSNIPKPKADSSLIDEINEISKLIFDGNIIEMSNSIFEDNSNEIAVSTDNDRHNNEIASDLHRKERRTRSVSNRLSTTPEQLGSGVLPSGYDDIVFELYDGNWTQDVILPLQPVDGTRVVIKSTATFDADLHLPFTRLKIKWGSEYIFEYQEDVQQWNIQGPGVTLLTPKSVGSIISDNLQGIIRYEMKDNDWVPEITLPSNVEDESLVIIRSTSSNDSKVSVHNLLYASTTTIKAGDQYVFKYLKKLERWVVESAPIRNVEIDTLQGEIPSPTSQMTKIIVTDEHWWDKVTLPEKASDRDKITLKSLTHAATLIDTANVNEAGAMKLHHGEQYDFFYLAEKGKWQLISSPDTYYQAQDIVSGSVPELKTPRTIINSANGNYQPNLYLPTAQEPGSQIIINSKAELDISVLADDSNYKVSKDETVAFKVDEQGHWERETVTIDLLLLYSDKAADRLGEEVMRNRLIEGLNLTNEALENSGANFRYRQVGLKHVAAKAHWSALGNPLGELRDDTTVQEWRNTLKANGIYYEGTEDGCGLGRLGPWGGDYHMVATGSINCGTIVMRHELGHNMGLEHGGKTESINQGYGLLSTIMAGNAIPYYSTPERYTADYGIPMGIPGKIDGVQAMNGISAAVAAYR